MFALFGSKCLNYTKTASEATPGEEEEAWTVEGEGCSLGGQLTWGVIVFMNNHHKNQQYSSE